MTNYDDLVERLRAVSSALAVDRPYASTVAGEAAVAIEKLQSGALDIEAATRAALLRRRDKGEPFPGFIDPRDA